MSGLPACQADTLSLKPCLQPVLLVILENRVLLSVQAGLDHQAILFYALHSSWDDRYLPPHPIIV